MLGGGGGVEGGYSFLTVLAVPLCCMCALLIKHRCALLLLARDKQMRARSAACGGFHILHRQLQLER